LDDVGRRLLERSAERLHLSARGFHRVLKVARTIADLSPAPSIAPEHVAEALQYRLVD
jgi:magnesium chelatase family protein